MAGLLKYFSVKQHKNDGDGKSNCLPDPNGELSKVVPSSSIEATNTVVHEALVKRSHVGHTLHLLLHRSIPLVKELLKMGPL